MAEAPENLQSAFDLAFSYNADGIEFDVRLTADGLPVVFHDETLKKIDGTRDSVSDRNLEDLAKLDFGRWYSGKFSGQKIMTLEALLNRYAGRGILMAELKAGREKNKRGRHLQNLCRAAAGLIDIHVPGSVRDQVFILSFDKQIMEEIKFFAPDLKRIFNMSGPPGKNDLTPEFRESLWGVCFPEKKLSADSAGLCHNIGLRVAVYSCNTWARTAAALDAGADVVMTDDPGRVANRFFSHNVLTCQK